MGRKEGARCHWVLMVIYTTVTYFVVVHKSVDTEMMERQINK